MQSKSSPSRRGVLLIAIISPALLGSQVRCTFVSNPTVATARIEQIEPITPRVGDIVHVTGSGNGTPPLQFAWDFGDGTLAVGTQAAHAYLTAGSYQLTFTVRDANGNAARDSSQVTVFAPTVTPTTAAATEHGLASLASNPARAELPRHVHLQELTPLPEEAFSPLDGQRQDNQFGLNVVIRNGLAFIGMPAAMMTGKVAVFTQSTTGWVRTATIVASDRTTDDGFGQAISFRDGLLVVGSTRAAYVYKRVDGVWRERQKILPPEADRVDRFGDLEHEAGVLAIAAFASGNIGSSDSVYVFEQDANGRFVRSARLMPSTGSRAGFGTSIGMTRRIIVIGSFARSAYVFGRNSSGKWVQRQKLIASSRAEAFDGYGEVVAVDDGMILVAAPDAGVSPVSDQSGDVYVFLPGAAQYVEAFRLHPPLNVGGAGTRFGRAIAISDKYIAVGASEIPFIEGNPPGIVTTYLREGSSVRVLGIVADTGHTVARGPTSIDIANNLLLVGSPFDESCSHFDDFCEPTGINIGEVNLLRLNQFAP